MEPNVSSPQFRPEKVPAQKEQQTEPIPESFPSKGSPFEVEKNQAERASELSSSESQVLPPPVLPTPVVAPQQQTLDDNPKGIISTPTVAADDDLIEKEWVKKAKEIIASTYDNPRKRETEVSYLQRDYLKKRYGREIGTRS